MVPMSVWAQQTCLRASVETEVRALDTSLGWESGHGDRPTSAIVEMARKERRAMLDRLADMPAECGKESLFLWTVLRLQELLPGDRKVASLSVPETWGHSVARARSLENPGAEHLEAMAMIGLRLGATLDEVAPYCLLAPAAKLACAAGTFVQDPASGLKAVAPLVIERRAPELALAVAERVLEKRQPKVAAPLLETGVKVALGAHKPWTAEMTTRAKVLFATRLLDRLAHAREALGDQAGALAAWGTKHALEDRVAEIVIGADTFKPAPLVAKIGKKKIDTVIEAALGKVEDATLRPAAKKALESLKKGR